MNENKTKESGADQLNKRSQRKFDVGIISKKITGFKRIFEE